MASHHTSDGHPALTLLPASGLPHSWGPMARDSQAVPSLTTSGAHTPLTGGRL